MKDRTRDFEIWWAEHKDNHPASPRIRRSFAAGYECAINRVLGWLTALITGISLVMMILALTGCADRYRYACQDPKNWEREECKRPLCAATQTCPDLLGKPEEQKGEVR